MENKKHIEKLLYGNKNICIYNIRYVCIFGAPKIDVNMINCRHISTIGFSKIEPAKNIGCF